MEGLLTFRDGDQVRPAVTPGERGTSKRPLCEMVLREAGRLALPTDYGPNLPPQTSFVHNMTLLVCALRPDFGPPDAGVFRLGHGDGLTAPPG